jgi:hypothetical protein
MRRVIAVSILSLALGVACTHVAPTVGAPATAAVQSADTSEDARLNAWFERKYEEQLQFSPMQMTMLGRKDRYGELDDMSREAAARQLAWMEAAYAERTRGCPGTCSSTSCRRRATPTASATTSTRSSRWAAPRPSCRPS